MNRFSLFFLIHLCAVNILPAESIDNPTTVTLESKEPSKISHLKFEPFTGKISKTKVRMRLQPNYDGLVLREMQPEELVVVVNETDDFYAIRPPSDFKAYIYRTFVLDNVVEGNNVNVRLKPDLDAPVITKLNSGDPIQGKIDPDQNKWLVIDMPANAYFYIAKEYVNKIGDAGLMARLEKKKSDAYQLLTTNETVSKMEMIKPFEQINIDGIRNNYQHLILDYPEFPEVAIKAKELLLALQEEYANKKLEYADSQHSMATHRANQQLNNELYAHKAKINELENRIKGQQQEAPSHISQQMPLNMSIWKPIEENYFMSWAQQCGNASIQDFYSEQHQNATILRGLIEPYTRSIKNKPGDYLLLNPVSRLPIAYLYSTQVNLQAVVGHSVSIIVSPRPNNHFAYPAYFVLSFE